jgi:hypothetical protein
MILVRIINPAAVLMLVNPFPYLHPNNKPAPYFIGTVPQLIAPQTTSIEHAQTMAQQKRIFLPLVSLVGARVSQGIQEKAAQPTLAAAPLHL